MGVALAVPVVVVAAAVGITTMTVTRLPSDLLSVWRQGCPAGRSVSSYRSFRCK